MALKSGRVGIHPSQVDPITGMLLNGPIPGSISFEDLSDVQITDPEDGALLVYDSASGKWVNSVTPPAPVVPDGNTVTPTGDVETWLSCAGIDDKSYTTLSDILSDSVTFNALLGDSNANKYMARSTTWASTLCADQYAMTMIGQYDVCCDALLGNSTWASAINSSTYSDYVSKPLVPTMTSNTTPSGYVASASSIYGSGYEAYKAFDNNASTFWNASGSSDYIQIEFPTAVVIKYVRALVQDSNKIGTYKIQASNDGFSSDVHDLTDTLSMTSVNVETFLNNDVAYKYYRFNQLSITGGSTSCALVSLQFYGHASSGEKIHGANNETAYYLDGATQVPISNPSTLDAGTYTFGSTIAKNPDSLSSDYTKQIRITPNTVEVVLRPDKSLYWWGYESANVEDAITANGWSFSNYTLVAPTHNTNSINMSGANGKLSGVASKSKVNGTNAYAIATGVRTDNGYGYLNAENSKAMAFNTQTKMTSSSMTKYSVALNNQYVCVEVDGAREINLHAMWYE